MKRSKTFDSETRKTHILWYAEQQVVTAIVGVSFLHADAFSFFTNSWHAFVILSTVAGNHNLRNFLLNSSPLLLWWLHFQDQKFLVEIGFVGKKNTLFPLFSFLLPPISLRRKIKLYSRFTWLSVYRNTSNWKYVNKR